MTGREFVVTLGCDLDHAYNGLTGMRLEELRLAKEILSAPDAPEASEWHKNVATAALAWIEKELGKRQ